MKQEIKLEDVFNDEKRQGIKELIDAHKQETLEEAAKNNINNDLDLYESLVDGHISYNIGIDLLNNLFIKGAKWQAERMYSEDDMEKAFTNGLNRSFDSDFDRWFEQFKKK